MLRRSHTCRGPRFLLPALCACAVAAAPAWAKPAGQSSRFAALSLASSAGLEQALDLTSKAAGRGAGYVVVPEWRMPVPETVAGPTVQRFAELARRRGIWIAVPIAEDANAGGKYFETTVLLNANGERVANYRKVLARTDNGAVERGSVYTVLESVPAPGLRIGVVAGDDMQFGVARLAARGASTVLVTAAWDGAEANDWPRICRELSRKYRINIVVSSRNRAFSGAYLAKTDAPEADEDGVALAAVENPPIAIAGSLGLPSVPAPAYYESEAALIEAGRQLFFDTGLSGTRRVSCATCHNPRTAFANHSPKAAGVDGIVTRRNVPSLLNVAYRGMLFWDGLSSSLESQAKFPMTHAHEMNRHYLDSVGYVRAQARYRDQFRAAGRERIEYDDVAAALASYQRSLISGNSPFDRYLYAGDASALSAAAARGMDLFRGKANCSTCHLIGPDYALLMDQQFHNTGVAYDTAGARFTDTGFGAISYQGKPGLFLTPSLRNVARTAPYMHDGSFVTLREVVAFYNRGGRPNPYLDSAIKPLHLTERESADLVAFLESLNGAESYSAQGRKLSESGIAAVEFTPAPGDIQANRRRVETLVERAAAGGATLVVLPERIEAGASFAFLSGLAKRNRVWLVGMAPELETATGRRYLSSLCFDPQGKLAGKARKVTPDARDKGIAAGDFRRLEPIPTALGPLGILSASDLMRGAPRLGARGARLIAVSASWTESDAANWTGILKQLEAESGATIIVAGLREGEGRTVAWKTAAPTSGAALGLPPVPQPAATPASQAGVELGRKLFFDASLSRDGRISCANCHDPKRSFASPQKFTPGVFGRVGKTHVPTLMNSGFRLFQTWEGRVESAEEQIRNALLGWSEMDMTEAELLRTVAAKPEYGSLRRFDDITGALASYVRTLVSGDSPFDRFFFAKDTGAIDLQARRGLALFRGKAHCSQCHAISSRYALFADNRFHNTGVGYKRYFDYLGYSGDGVEGNLVTKNKFRGEYLTPTLRNIALTAPYMHDGSLATLRDVVEFYDRGGNPNPFLDPRIRPLHLTAAERADLIAFLETLTGHAPPANTVPQIAQGVERHAVPGL